MAETKIPNSEDLFEIYKEQLKLVNDINQIIVKNKMDKKFFNTLKKCIERSTDAIETVLYGLERISGAYSAVSINAKDLKSMTDTIYEYQILMETIGKIPLKDLIGNKFRMILLRKSMRSLFKFVEKLGSYNTINIIKAKISLKAMEPIMESLEIVASPLKKISLGDVIKYRFTVIKYKMLFRKLIRLIEFIGDRKLTPFAKAKVSIKFIADTINLIPTIFEVLKDKITFKQIFQYRRTISKIYVLLFGRIYDRIFRRSHSIMSLIENIGRMEISTAIKARINMLMISKTFESLNETLHFINEHMSWLEKNQIQTNLDRMWKLLFGEEYGWIGRNVFRRKGKKQRGIMDLIEGVLESLEIVDALKAAGIAISLVVFFKAINIVLRSLNLLTGLFGKLRYKRLRKGIQRLYIILFGTSKDPNDGGGSRSIMGIMMTFGKNEENIKNGFICVFHIVESIVDIFKKLKEVDLKTAASSKALLRTFIWDIRKLIKIVKLLTDKKAKILEKSEDAKKVIDNMKYMIDKFIEIIKASPDLAQQAKFGICLISICFAINFYSNILEMVKELKEESLLSDDAFNLLQSTLDSMISTIKKMAEAANTAPAIADSYKILLCMVVMVGAILIYGCVLWITGKFISMGLVDPNAGPNDKNSAQIVIAAMAATLKDFTEATKNAPEVKKTGEIAAILGTMMLSIVIYEGMLWVISLIDKKLGDDRSKAQERASQIVKDMASTMKEFGEAIKVLPKKEDLKDSTVSILLMMTIMVGMIVVIHILNKSQRESRRAYRASMLIRMVFYSIVIIALAVIGIGAMVVIGAAMISIAIGFIAGVLALMVLLALGRRFIKEGAIALLVISLSLAILTLIMYALVEMSEKVNFFKLAGVVILMGFVIGGIAATMFVLGAIMESKEGAWLLAEGAVALLAIAGVMWCIAKLFEPIAQIAIMTKDTDLGKTVRIMSEVVLGMTGLILVLGGMITATMGGGAIVMAIGAATVLAIGGIIWAIAESMKAIAAAVTAWSKIHIPGMNMNDPDGMGIMLGKMLRIPIIALAMDPLATGPGGKQLRWSEDIEPGSILHFLAKFDRRTIKDAKKVTIGLSTVIEGVGNIARTIAMIPPYEGDAENFKTMIISVMGAIIATAEYFDNDAKKARIVKRIFRNMKKTISFVGDMAKTMVDVSFMRFPVKIDEKTGQIKEYALADQTKFETAGKNIQQIITSMIGAFDLQDESGKSNLDKLDDISKRQIKKVKKIMELAVPISGMVDTINKLSKMLVPFDKNSIDQKTGKINKWKLADSKYFANAAKNVALIVSNYVKTVDIGQENGSLKDVWNLVTAGNKRRIEHTKALMELSDPISKLVDTIIKMKALKVPDTSIEGYLDPNTGEIKKWKLLNTADISDAAKEIAKFVKDYVEAFDLPNINFGKESFWDKIKGTKKNNEDSVKKIMDMTSPINSLMDTIIKYKSAKYPTKIDEKTGEPTGWKMIDLSKEDPTKTIFDIIGKFVTNLTSNTTIKDAIKDQATINSVETLIKSLGSMSDPMSKIINVLQSVKPGSLSFTKIGDTTNTPAGHAVNLIAKSIFQNVNGSNLNQRTSAWKQATDDSVKLIKSVNTLDISKVTSLKELMHELYLFSDSIQGNFDKLADVINEKLLTVLEKLTNSLDKVSETDFGEPSGTGKPTPIANPAHNANEDTRKNSKDSATKKAVEQLQSDMNSLKSLINDLSKCIDRTGQAALRITEK